METILGGEAGATQLIKDSDTQNFVADVIEASKEVPVVVDFWAPWCGPCKELGPQIERAVTARSGKVKLVKINVDENQEIAAQFQIQSIPAVYAFNQGRPVDGFAGAIPESQIQAFIDRIAGETGPSPIDTAVEQATTLMEAGDHLQASAIFEQVLEHDPTNAPAISGSIRCQIAGGDLAGARARFDAIDPTLTDHATIAGAQAALELAEETVDSGDATTVAALRSQLAENPNDHQVRYDFACALWGNGEHEPAIDELLEIVRRNRAWNEEAARKQLVKYFDAIGHSDPLTLEARGRLSSLLFA